MDRRSTGHSGRFWQRFWTTDRKPITVNIYPRSVDKRWTCGLFRQKIEAIPTWLQENIQQLHNCWLNRPTVKIKLWLNVRWSSDDQLTIKNSSFWKYRCSCFRQQDMQKNSKMPWIGNFKVLSKFVVNKASVFSSNKLTFLFTSASILSFSLRFCYKLKQLSSRKRYDNIPHILRPNF